MSIDALENNTKVITPDNRVGRVRVTRRERRLISDNKLNRVDVLGSNGLTASFNLSDLIIVKDTPIKEEDMNNDYDDIRKESRKDSINITINISDTVPLLLYREMQDRYNSIWNSKQEMEQTAAELRIEVAALTVDRDSVKSRISGLHSKVRELEDEKRELLHRIIKYKEESKRNA